MKQSTCFSIGNFIKLPSFVCLLTVLLSLSMTVKGQTTYTIGASGYNYTSINAAIAGITGGGGPTGGAILLLESNYAATSESITAVSWASSSQPVIIRPAATLAVSGSGSTLWNLSGCSYVTIDGRIGGTGSTISLSLTNTSTSGVTVQMINGANHNTIQYTNVYGENTSVTAGTISIMTSSTVGNSNNTVTYCNIGDVSGSTPMFGIYSAGSSGYSNDNLSITNNNIYNYYSSTSATYGGYGIFISTYTSNTAGSITNIGGNSFYQTSARTGYQGASTGAILINNTSGYGYQIYSNYIGGSSASCGGSAYSITSITTTTSTSLYLFKGIQISANSSATLANESFIYGNTFQNLIITSYNSSNNNGTVSALISIQGGSVYCGVQTDGVTANGNLLGKTSTSAVGASASVQYVGSVNNGYFTGINVSDGTASANVTVSNNTIAGITVQSTTTVANSNLPISTNAIIVYFAGIEVSTTGNTSTYTISNNNVGNSAAEGVAAGSMSIQNYTGRNTMGIQIGGNTDPNGGTTINVTGNAINNISNIEASTSANAGYLMGINVDNCPAPVTISNNVISNLICTNSAVNTTVTPACAGINIAFTSGATNTVSGNTIYNLYSAKYYLDGIFLAPNSGTTTASANLIYNIYSNTTASAFQANGAGIGITGIRTYIAGTNAPTISIVNNMIRLGYDSTGTNSVSANVPFIGIRDSVTTTAAAKIYYYFNTVYVGGSAANTSANPTYAFLLSGGATATTSSTRVVENNLLVNARTSSAGSPANSNYSFWDSTGTGIYAGTVTVNYNDYVASGTGGELAYIQGSNTNTINTTYMGSNSINTAPTFTGATSATPNLSLTSANSSLQVGTTITTPSTITTDFYGNTRESTPYIGAYEWLPTTTWTGASSNVWTLAGNWSNGVPTSTISTTIPSSLSTYPSLTTTAAVGQLTVASGATITNTGSLQVNGNASVVGTITGAGTVVMESLANLSGAGTINNLQISAVTVTLTGNISVDTLTVLSGGTLADGGYTLTNSGNLNIVGTHTSTSSGEIKMTGTSSPKIYGGGVIGTLEIAPGGSNTITVSTAPSVIKNLILTSGILADGGNEIKVTGNVTGTGTESGTGRITMSYVTSQAVGTTQGSASATVTLSAANSSIAVGQTVFGGSVIYGGTTVSAISGTTLTLSGAGSAALTAGTVLYFSTTHTFGSASGTMTIGNLATSSTGYISAVGNVIISGDFVALPQATTGNNPVQIYNDGGYITGIGGNTFNYGSQRASMLSNATGSTATGKVSLIGTATSSGLISTGTVSAGSTSGFAIGDTVYLTSGTGVTYGVPAKATVTTLSGSTVTAITVFDPGSGYGGNAPTGFVAHSGAGTGTGSLTSAVIATSTATKYINVGISVYLFNNLELANTVTNNTVSNGKGFNVQGTLGFATAAQSVLGTSGGNTSGTFTFTSTSSSVYIGGNTSNTNLATAAAITMASTNYFIGGTSGSPLGGIFAVSSGALGPIYFSPTANVITLLEQNTNNTGNMTIGNAVVPSTVNLFSSANLVVGSGGNLTLPVTASISITGSGAIDATNSNATVTLANTTTIASGTFVSSTVGNLTVTNAAPTLSQAITVNGTLTLNATTATSYTFTNSTNLTMASGSSIVYNKTSTGTQVLSAAPTFSGTVGISYTGSTAITTGNELPSASSVVSSLTINNSAGVTLNASLTTNTSSTLTLTSGLLTLNAFNLTLGTGSTITGASTSNYILAGGSGVFTINGVAVSTATLFPIGFNHSSTNYYTPLTITNTGSGATNITANASYLSTAVGVSSKVVDIQWSVLASSAITASIVYQFNSGNEAGSFSTGTGNIDLGAYNGSSYSITSGLSTSGSGPYTVSATGLSVPTSGTNLYVIGNTGDVSALTYTTWVGGDGSTPTAWTDANNWNGGILPTSTLDAIIPSSLTYYPSISSTVACNNLTLGSGATITNTGILQVNSSITNNGTISGSGAVTLVGSVAQAISGSGSISNLTVNNSSGASVSSGSQTLSGALTLTAGTLVLTGSLTVNGSVTNGGGALTGSSHLTYGSGIPVTYTAAVTTGSELTPNSGSVGTLTINASGSTVTLGSAATVSGLALTAGTLADGGFTLTNSGALSGTGTHTGAGEIKMTNGSSITGAVTLATLEIAPGSSNTVNVSTAPSVIKNLILTSGTLTDGGNEIKVTGNVTGTGKESGTGRITMAYVTSQAVGTTQGGASTTVTLSASNSAIVVGQTVFGGTINGGTTVSAISGTTLTLSGASASALTAGTVLYFSNTHTFGSSSGTMTIGNFATSSTGLTLAAGNVIISGDFVALPQATTGNNSVQIYNDGGYITGIGGNTFNMGSQRANIFDNSTGSSATGKISLIGTATSSGLISTGTITSAGSGYVTGDTIQFNSGTYGVVAKGTVTAPSGAVTAITMIDPGSGYSALATSTTLNFSKYSGSGTAGTVTSPIIDTSNLTKYMGVGDYFLFNNLELANTAANNTVTNLRALNIEGNLSFATAAQSVLGTSGGNTSGTFTFASSSSTLYIGGNASNTNIATAAAITMASTNYFIGGTSGSALGGLFAVSSSALGPIYFSPTANVITTLEQNVNNTGSMTIATAVVPSTVSLLSTSTGTLVVGSGGNLTLPATVTLSGAGAINATNSNATITLANATTIASGTFVSSSVGNLVITNAAPTLNQAITVSNSLTLNSTTTASYTVTNGSNLTIGSGVTVTKNKTGTGKLSLGTVPTFSSLSATNFSYTGSVLDTIGNEMPVAANTINTLTINNSGNVTMKGYDITTSGALTLTSGDLITGNNNMIAGSVSGGIASSFVLINGAGTLTSSATSGTAKLYPVGTRGGYTPLIITPSATQTYAVGLTNGYSSSIAYPGDTTQVLKVEWSVLGTSAPTTATIKYGFSTSQFSSAYTVAPSELGYYQSSAWVIASSATSITPTNDSTTHYSLTATGLSIPTSGNNYYAIGDVGNVVVTATQWTGTFNTDWGNYLNWTNNVPTSLIAATIPAGGYQPVISVSESVKTLTVASGATVTNNSTLTIAGTSFGNNGTISGSGTTILAGTALQTVSGTGIVGNLTVNNGNGVTVSSGSNNLGISGVLTLQTGKLTTNGNVTLKSLSISNSGVLAPYGVSGNSGTISGTVTVERYIPAGYRAYRDMAPEVYNASNYIFNTWQENGSYTTGYGIFITGPTSIDASQAHYNEAHSGYSTATGLDSSTTGISSAYTYGNGAWPAITNTTTTKLDPFQGYRVLVRGDRGFNLESTPIQIYPAGLRMYDATTLRASGQLVTGTVTYGTTGVTNTATGGSTYALNGTGTSSFSVVANPYVCPVDWNLVYAGSSNINASYWYLNPTAAATGSYQAYNALSGSNIYSDEPNAGEYVQAGQAVFVQNQSSTSPSVVFTESTKAVTSTKASVFGTTALLSKIYISLGKQASGTTTYDRVDGTAIAFAAGFTNDKYGPQDALKFSGASDNIYIGDKGENLSIDGRLPASSSDAIALKISGPSTTTYQLQVDATRYINDGYMPLLYDAYKNTTTALGSGVTTVDFTVDSKTTASYADRFTILFSPSALAINSIVASATLNDKVATITWNTLGEKGESYFEVEKSTDGRTFASIGQQAAKNTASASYTATDNSVAEGNNYYRIKAVSETGAINYSNVAKLAYNASLTNYSLYPNPLVGKTLNIGFANVNAGKYVVSIHNVLGEKVVEQAITHEGGSASHAITVNSTLAGGIYSVTIMESGSNQIVHQTSLSVQP